MLTEQEFKQRMAELRDSVSNGLMNAYMQNYLSVKNEIYKVANDLLPSLMTESQRMLMMKAIEDGYIKFNFTVERNVLPNINELMSSEGMQSLIRELNKGQ